MASFTNNINVYWYGIINIPTVSVLGYHRSARVRRSLCGCEHKLWYSKLVRHSKQTK